MSDRSAQRTLNLDTYEALQAVGLTEPQARVLAAAIPDLEPLRIEMDHLRMELRSEMDRRFAGLETAAQRADLGHRGHLGGHWRHPGRHQSSGLKSAGSKVLV